METFNVMNARYDAMTGHLFGTPIVGERTRFVLEARARGMTLKAIGIELKVTPERVRQIIKAAQPMHEMPLREEETRRALGRLVRVQKGARGQQRLAMLKTARALADHCKGLDP